MKVPMRCVVMMWCVLLAWGCGERRTEERPAGDVPRQAEEVQPAAVDTPKVVAEEKPVQTAKQPSPPPVQKGVTIIGEVIDIVSYATSGVRANTPEGKEIITASARGGNPLGILETGGGTVYVVTMRQGGTAANETLLPWVGMQIAAKGDVYRKGDQQLLVMTVIGKNIK